MSLYQGVWYWRDKINKNRTGIFWGLGTDKSHRGAGLETTAVAKSDSKINSCFLAYAIFDGWDGPLPSWKRLTLVSHSSIRFDEENNTENILWLYLVTKCNRDSKFCVFLKQIHIKVLQMKVNLTIFKLSWKVKIFNAYLSF